MQVKYYDGRVEDLGLYMAVSEDTYGVVKQIPLVPDGENTPVTNDNRLQYIMYYANYMLNLRTQEQTRHFVKGLESVIPKDVLGMFFPNEI